LIKRGAEAAAWEPDDPRVAELATADHFLANPDHSQTGLPLTALSPRPPLERLRAGVVAAGPGTIGAVRRARPDLGNAGT
jgi:hypothetical protein